MVYEANDGRYIEGVIYHRVYNGPRDLNFSHSSDSFLGEDEEFVTLKELNLIVRKKYDDNPEYNLW